MNVKLPILLYVVLALAPCVWGDPTVFTINHRTANPQPPGNVEDLQIARYEFGTTDFIDGLDNGKPKFFYIVVNSGPSNLPGFQFQLSFDYAAYDIGFFGPNGFVQGQLVDVNPPGSPQLIEDVFVEDPTGNVFGNFSTDGSSIFFAWSTSGVLDAGNGPIVIHWNQTAGGIVGDVNQDGSVNLLDVDPFVDRVTTGDYQFEADVNGDGLVNLLDVDPFVKLLSAG